MINKRKLTKDHCEKCKSKDAMVMLHCEKHFKEVKERLKAFARLLNITRTRY